MYKYPLTHSERKKKNKGRKPISNISINSMGSGRAEVIKQNFRDAGTAYFIGLTEKKPVMAIYQAEENNIETERLYNNSTGFALLFLHASEHGVT